MRAYWWVVLFCVSCGVLHLHFLTQKKDAIAELEARLEDMNLERIAAQRLRGDLKERLASQSDPAWIELVLMRDLGVVPEGFLKVHFKR